jgi:hypothetical protein
MKEDKLGDLSTELSVEVSKLTNIKITHVANMHGGQDGAIYGGFLFRFNAKGVCRVYDASAIEAALPDVAELPVLSTFVLDRAEEISPHANAVVFGKEFYAAGDEFPLLYSNIYNNYAKAEDPLCGVCCVYRLQREGLQFTSTLVQLIEIGFTDDRALWRSAGDTVDTRPYGNFVIDTSKGVYYAFVMRDGDHTTRYFAFDLPGALDGQMDGRLNVRRVTLSAADVRDCFDAPYHHYVQGACLHGGLIYSVEGFHERIRPALRIIDPAQKKQILHYDFYEAGFGDEAEFIDFYHGTCYYGDAAGHLFKLELLK